MKHFTCEYFDKFIKHLEAEWTGFQINKLAEQLGCGRERIRRIRNGDVIMDANDLAVLKKHYNANYLFLLEGKLPLRITGDMMVVEEPAAAYSKRNEIELLKQNIEDKELIIKLLQQQVKQLESSQQTTHQKRA